MPKNLMIKSTSFVLFFTWSCIAISAPMGIIFAEGNKPSRVIYVAEFLNAYDHSSSLSALMNAQTDADFKKLQNEQNQVEMRIIGIYENKNNPESTDMTLEFQCHQKTYRIRQAHTMLRDGTEKFPTQDWQPLASGNSALPTAAAEVACNQAQVSNAAKQVAASKDGQDFTAFDKLGIIYIGDVDRLQAVDTVWKTMLADGTRPAYKDKTLTAEETKAWNEKIDKKLAEAKKQTAGYEALATAELGKMKEEREYKKEIAKNSSKHGKQLKWLLGNTEAEIVRAAGNPVDAIEKNQKRYLSYYNEYVIGGVGYTRDNNGNYVGTGTTVTCEVQIEMQKKGAKAEFRAIDYRLFASNGGCRDLSWVNRTR